jgi:hypothetical protein
MDRNEMIEIERKYEATGVMELSKKEAILLVETSDATRGGYTEKIHFMFGHEKTPWHDDSAASVVTIDGKRATAVQMKYAHKNPGNASLPIDFFQKAVSRAKPKESLTIVFNPMQAKILIGRDLETTWVQRESIVYQHLNDVVFFKPEGTAEFSGLNLHYLAAAKKMADAADQPHAKLTLGKTELDPMTITVENQDTERNYRLVISPVRL